MSFDAAVFGFLDGEEVGEGVPRPFPRIRPLSAWTFFAISSAVTGESFAGAVCQSHPQDERVLTGSSGSSSKLSLTLQ
jgi:hypothetical protein